MKKTNVISAICLGLIAANPAHGMGLRSFVALPVESGGAVIRFLIEHANDANTDIFMASSAYGLSNYQTLLFTMPYRLSPGGENQLGDFSALYRHTLWQQDSFSGTTRLAFLGGAIIPTTDERDTALQAGLVITHFKGRHEIDIDALYQAGIDKRTDSGRYDISWQYRLSPSEHPDWGIASEWHSVVELNGRWQQGNKITQQITLGLQWVSQKWVIEGGLVSELNRDKDSRYILSTRFHF